MKRKNDMFHEIKVKMVMKLKKLSRREAVEEIAKMDAAKRKAADEESREATETIMMEREALRSRRGQSPNICRSGSDDLLSAEDFFAD